MRCKNYSHIIAALAEKPLSAIKRGHKLRTRAKREFKRAIAAEVASAVAALRRGRLRPFPAGQNDSAAQSHARPPQSEKEICS